LRRALRSGAARRSRGARRSPAASFLYGFRDAAARRRCRSIRRDHRRRDLLPAGSDRADARILGGHAPPACVMRRAPCSLGARCPRRALRSFRSLCVLCFLCALCVVARAQGGGTTRFAILEAEDRRAPTARDLTVLRSGARSGNAQTARVAVRALGRLERPALAADIVPALRHPLPEVRSEAANAIGQAVQGW